MPLIKCSTTLYHTQNFYIFCLLCLGQIIYNHLKIKMLGIVLASETFQKLLFKTQVDSPQTKAVLPMVFASLKSQVSKKSTIVIISNGLQQNLDKQRRKRYVFSGDELQDESSQVVSFTRQKKHLIKKQIKQDPDYSVKRQKSDRNVVSNIIHHLMKHALTCIKNETLTDIFYKKEIKLPLSQFFRILQQKDKMCKTYITNKHLKQLWIDSTCPQFGKAMRIISRIFLQSYSFLTIFNGNKLNQQSKAIHYRGRRELIQFMSKLK